MKNKRVFSNNIVYYLNNNNNGFLGLLCLLTTIFIIMLGIYNIVISIQEMYCFSLSQIKIIGQLNYTKNSDIKGILTAVGTIDNFINQDVVVIKNHIEKLSWVKYVSVRKQWPDMLKIYIIEYIPVAYWNDINVIDMNGVIFSIPFDRIRETWLPMLYGPEGSELCLLNNYHVFDEILHNTNLSKLEIVKIDNRYSWHIILQDGICLKLGKKDVVERLKKFVKVYAFFIEDVIKQNKYIDYIDLRYDSGFAVSWITSAKNSKQEHLKLKVT